MGLRPTYMDETHLESMSFDGVGGYPTGTTEFALRWCYRVPRINERVWQ